MQISREVQFTISTEVEDALITVLNHLVRAHKRPAEEGGFFIFGWECDGRFHVLHSEAVRDADTDHHDMALSLCQRLAPQAYAANSVVEDGQAGAIFRVIVPGSTLNVQKREVACMVAFSGLGENTEACEAVAYLAIHRLEWITKIDESLVLKYNTLLREIVRSFKEDAMW